MAWQFVRLQLFISRKSFLPVREGNGMYRVFDWNQNEFSFLCVRIRFIRVKKRKTCILSITNHPNASFTVEIIQVINTEYISLHCRPENPPIPRTSSPHPTCIQSHLIQFTQKTNNVRNQFGDPDPYPQSLASILFTISSRSFSASFQKI